MSENKADPVRKTLIDRFTRWVERYALKICPPGCLPLPAQEREISLFAEIVRALAAPQPAAPYGRGENDMTDSPVVTGIEGTITVDGQLWRIKAKSIGAALEEISLARATGSLGSSTIIDSSLCGGAKELCAEVHKVEAALAAPQPSADSLFFEPSGDGMPASIHDANGAIVCEARYDDFEGDVSRPERILKRLVALHAAPQPAAPLGGRETIVDELAQDMLGHAFCADWHDDPDKGVREVARIKALFVDSLNGFADAILAIPQERGVDRAAIIEECAKVIEQYQERISETSNGSERSVSPRMHGNLMGLAYADAIRALGKETGR